MDWWSQSTWPLLNIRMPASGDMLMNYQPWTNWGVADVDAGDPEIEREVFTHVALPGKQLGRLMDAVTALIDHAEESNRDLAQGDSERAIAIRELRELARDVRLRKESLQDTKAGAAERTLRDLKQADRAAFKQIIEREYKDLTAADRDS